MSNDSIESPLIITVHLIQIKSRHNNIWLETNDRCRLLNKSSLQRLKLAYTR